MKIELSGRIFEKFLDVKFRENTFSGSRVVPVGETDRQKDTTKLIIAFRNFANVQKKWLNLHIKSYTSRYIACFGVTIFLSITQTTVFVLEDPTNPVIVHTEHIELYTQNTIIYHCIMNLKFYGSVNNYKAVIMLINSGHILYTTSFHYFIFQFFYFIENVF